MILLRIPLRPSSSWRSVDHQGKNPTHQKRNGNLFFFFGKAPAKYINLSPDWIDLAHSENFEKILVFWRFFFWSFCGQNFPKHTSQASVSKNLRFGVAKNYKTSRHFENLVHFQIQLKKKLLEVEIDQSSWGYIERWWFGSTTRLIRLFNLKLLVPSKVHGFCSLPWPNWVTSLHPVLPTTHRFNQLDLTDTGDGETCAFQLPCLGLGSSSRLGRTESRHLVTVEMFGDVVVGWFVKLQEVQQNMFLFF